jgi:uroporphyrinogen-III synthase
MRVALTRPRERSGHGFETLRAAGFIPVQRRLIRIAPALQELTAAVPQVANADWLVFTSAEAVRALDRVLHATGAGWPKGIRAACVGPATAKAASQAGLAVGLVPRVYDGAALADALLQEGSLVSQRFFWPRAEAANTGLADRLREAGAHVTDVVAYTTVPNENGGLRLRRDIESGFIRAVLFFSPSAVDAYVEIVGVTRAEPVIGVIGRSTGERARVHGLAVHVQPATHTMPALAASLRAFVDSTNGM